MPSTFVGARGPSASSSPLRRTTTERGLPSRRADRGRDRLPRCHLRAVDRDDLVARLKAERSSGRVHPDAVDRGRRLAAGGHEEAGEEDEREDDVEGRAGEDHEHALPRAGTPVRIRAERITDVGDALVDARACLLRELLLAGQGGERGERGPCSVVVARVERATQPAGLSGETRRLLDCPAEHGVDIGGRGPMHTGNLHEAAERDHPDAVLDPVAGALDDRGREPDVELSRLHP